MLVHFFLSVMYVLHSLSVMAIGIQLCTVYSVYDEQFRDITPVFDLHVYSLLAYFSGLSVRTVFVEYSIYEHVSHVFVK